MLKYFRYIGSEEIYFKNQFHLFTLKNLSLTMIIFIYLAALSLGGGSLAQQL